MLAIEIDRVEGTLAATSVDRVYIRDGAVEVTVNGFSQVDIQNEIWLQAVNAHGVLAEARILFDDGVESDGEGRYEGHGTLNTNTDQMVALFGSCSVETCKSVTVRVFCENVQKPVAMGEVEFWNFPAGGQAPDNLVSGSEKLAQVEADLARHAGDKLSNPHGITPQMIRAVPMERLSSLATLAQLEYVGTYARDEIRSLNERSEMNEFKLDEHAGSKDNPHSVTKEQIGLGMVDDTPDMEKPLSEPQSVMVQSMLDMTRAEIQFDLQNYYRKDELKVYSKEEVDAKISTIPKFAIMVVEGLPTRDISDTTVYLVKSGDEAGNLYTEYIHVGGKWEQIGAQKIDLRGYATDADIDNLERRMTEAFAATQPKLNAYQMDAVNSGITSSKLASMVTRDDVKPRGDGTEVIAVIGGKEIKASAGAVSSVNNKTGDVVLDGEDIDVGAGDSRSVTKAFNDLESSFIAHAGNGENPHGVTADQIGAQKKLTAGANITITSSGVISASGGEGTVKSVANVQPTSDGNVPLTAQDIGALSKSGGNVGTGTTAGVLTLGATYDTAPRLEMESAFNAACSFNVPNSGKFDYTGEGPKASLKKGGKEVATEDDVKAVSDKVDAIEDTVNVNNRILVSDDGVDARIQHADEEAEDGWADDAVLVTQKRLDIGYPVNDDGMHPKNQSTQVVTTDGAVRIITLTQPAKVEGGTRDFVVYVNHTNPDAANDTYLMLGGEVTFYYDGESGEAGFQKFITIPKGVMSAWYFTEIPGGNVWAVGKRALAKYTQGA